MENLSIQQFRESTNNCKTTTEILLRLLTVYLASEANEFATIEQRKAISLEITKLLTLLKELATA